MINNNISQRLTELRTKSGLSREDLAEKLHISRQAVGKWERGEALPDIENILILSRFYGVTTDYLLDNDAVDENLAETPAIENKNTLSNNKNGGSKKRIFIRIAIAAILAVAVVICISAILLSLLF